MSKTIKNREEAIDVVVATLKDIEKRNPNFTIDIYGYYNEEENTLEIDTFANISGNSWLNDEHYLLIRRRPSEISKVEAFTYGLKTVCDCITHSTKEELKKMMEAEELDIEDIGELEYFLVKNYADEIDEAFNEYVDYDMDSSYFYYQAENAIEELEDELFSETEE